MREGSAVSDDEAPQTHATSGDETTAVSGTAGTSTAREVAIRRLWQPFDAYIDMSHEYFATEFVTDLAERLAEVSDGDLVAPPAVVAVPALQGLAYALDEPMRKRLFLNLMASAMDKDSTLLAHPAFAQAIKELSEIEAKLLLSLLRHDMVACVELRTPRRLGTGYATLRRHILDWHGLDANLPQEVVPGPAYIDNWVRLGVVRVDYSRWALDRGAYKWVTSCPEFVRARVSAGRGWRRVYWQRGIVERTVLGTWFARATCILATPAAAAATPTTRPSRLRMRVRHPAR